MSAVAGTKEHAMERASLMTRVFTMCARDAKNVALRRVLSTMTNAQIREALERMT